MSEIVVTSMWASMASWFTPTVLFCVLNLVIGTIFVASSYKPQSHQQDHQLGGDNPPQLARAPSLLDRVRSINLSLHKYDQPEPFTFDSRNPDPQNDPPQLVRAPSFLERVKSINLSSFKFETFDPSPPDTHHTDRESDSNQASDHHVTRSKSDRSGETPGRAQGKMKKSASASFVDGVMEGEQAEEADRRWPATVRGGEAASWGEDEGVDAKADDFINRFKQQLKLQRLDSLLRYQEMLGRGSGNESAKAKTKAASESILNLYFVV
ncbi:hypothetical protein RJ639_008399 [Escallonia herrerae]|uniref:DUF4408 domain-containing protein n=1 Tax=Escallonia herrerae TaxID=1293975 RepID=A0AA89AS15_9ASTE|nr:hypothetical protein RJ639_008399 [Escallonia herrerae]